MTASASAVSKACLLQCTHQIPDLRWHGTTDSDPTDQDPMADPSRASPTVHAAQWHERTL